MCSLCEEVINANQQLTAALERIVKDLAEDPMEKNVHKVVTQLSFSQFGFPYFKDKNGEALSGNKDTVFNPELFYYLLFVP